MTPTFDNGIAIYHNALTPDKCDEYISLYENHDDKLDRSKSKQVPPHLIKDTTIFLGENTVKEISNIIKPLVELYIEKYSVIIEHSNINMDHNIRLQKTDLEEGYHVWHCENTIKEGRNRILVFTIYLNTVEEGGETEFLYQRKRIPAKTGTACIFPADFMYTHRGNPPLTNSKYIITGWIISEE
jgi:hypothetical protein